MNKERLLNVARALRESKQPGAFSMERYMHPCGAPACALGHYASREDLQSEFKLRHNIPGDDEWLNASNGVVDKHGVPVHYDSSVIQEHFEIGWDDAEELFSENGCHFARTANDAAAYIYHWVKSRE
jgi:hypothetical protein